MIYFKVLWGRILTLRLELLSALFLFKCNLHTSHKPPFTFPNSHPLRVTTVVKINTKDLFCWLWSLYKYVFLSVWLLSLSVNVCEINHVTVWRSHLFIIAVIILCNMRYKYADIHFTVAGHLCCLHFGAITNSGTMNILLLSLVNVCTYCCCIALKVELLGL